VHDEIFECTLDKLEAVVDRWLTWFQEAEPKPYDEEGKLNRFWLHRAHRIAYPEKGSAANDDDGATPKNERETWVDFTRLDAFDRSCTGCESYLKQNSPSKPQKKGKSRRSDVFESSPAGSPRRESGPINAGIIFHGVVSDHILTWKIAKH
jgi:hypothetical protein